MFVKEVIQKPKTHELNHEIRQKETLGNSL
ncbi:MAG: hypothetical protein ACJAV8_002474 [Polaribacter sp.]|jgi:hypothetical protein